MRRRQRASHRGNSTRHFIGKLLGVAAVVVLLVLALTLFFRVEDVLVEGNLQYEAQEIVTVSGLKKGDNMFFIQKKAITEHLFRELPYISNVSVTRHFPSSVTLKVEESAPAAILHTESGIAVIGANGRVMDVLDALPEELFAAEITGVAVKPPSLGKPLSPLTEEDGAHVEELIALLSALEREGLLEESRRIAMDSEDYIELTYLERFSVRIPWGSDYDYKVRSLLGVLDYLEDNETGTIDMTRADGEVHFLP